MQPLTLMTWNVRYFGHGSGGLVATSGWMKKIAQAIAGLERIPDIIALQEVEQKSLRGGLRSPQLQRFESLLEQSLQEAGHAVRYQYMYFPAHRYQLRQGPALFTTGLAVMVADHLEVDSTDTHAITHFRLRALAKLKQERVVAHVRCRPRGGTAWIDLFNTHLSLPAFFKVGPHRVPQRMGYGPNQLEEAKNLLYYIRQASTGNQVILVGDFNSLPDSPVVEYLIDSGFIDAFSRATGLTGDALQEWGTAHFMHLTMHIDHVFSSPTLKWQSFEDHRVGGTGPFQGLSDHMPKIGQVQVAD